MANFSLFASNMDVTVHNVTIVAVMLGEDGYEKLVIEHEGESHSLNGANKYHEEFSKMIMGKVGYVETAYRGDRFAPANCYVFIDYRDQTLRRFPELDIYSEGLNEDGRLIPVVGWRCDSRPKGFRAPVGVVPGEAGEFIADETIEISFRVPKEFVELCKRYKIKETELLKAFVGDLCGLQNYISNPRADKYQSNGSDERRYAEAWLQRSCTGIKEKQRL